MKDARKIIRIITVVAALGLVLSIAVSYAGWTYIIDNPVKAKSTSSGITFLFPRPLGALTINQGEAPKTSNNLWGAADENGKVTEDDAKEHKLVDYTALSMEIINNTTTNAEKGQRLLISFEVIFCLSPLLIETLNYPFRDPYTITRNGKPIVEGTLYFPHDWSSYNAGVKDVKLEKDENNEAFTSGTFIKRSYLYYTATIRATELIKAGAELDINDFIVEPSESASTPISTTFVLDIKHTQDNEVACFASVKIIAEEYPPAEGT